MSKIATPTEVPTAVARLRSTWDLTVNRMLAGELGLPSSLETWFSSLRAAYSEPAIHAALPEPFWVAWTVVSPECF